MIGKVKWFDDTKGFGFITPDEEGPDLFVHHTDVRIAGRKTLVAGQPVECDQVDGERGPKAVKVRVLPTSRPAPLASNQ